MSLKLGLYGGTFSPPHKGHERIARAFISQCGLDVLLIMPASIPPHKRVLQGDDPEKRLMMAKLAFSDVDGAVVSHLELDRKGPSYTVDTLNELYRLYEATPDEMRIKLLCGTDMFLSLDSWRRSEEIFRIADIVYACRGEEDEDEKLAERARYYEKHYGAHCKSLELVPYEISSSEIRRMIEVNDDPTRHIKREVYDYIKETGLYETK